MRILFLFFAFVHFTLSASLPADISFMIADLKYSESEGIKICELQQGMLSAFSGYDFATESKGFLEEYVSEYLLGFGKPIYLRRGDVTNPSLQKIFTQKGALTFGNILHLNSNPLFSKWPALAVQDPTKLSDYHCIVVSSPRGVGSVSNFRGLFPGALLLDAASYPYWIDKYAMSLLFREEPLLEVAKPTWALFQKKYTPSLANEIAEAIGGDTFVIKPRGSFLGNGVMIVAREELDQLLFQIIEEKESIKRSEIKELRFWAHESQKSFIVEKFHPSDPLEAPHLNNKLFDPTMRVVFMMKYDRGEMTIDFVETYWKCGGSL